MKREVVEINNHKNIFQKGCVVFKKKTLGFYGNEPLGK
jgi:hypothetical protein